MTGLGSSASQSVPRALLIAARGRTRSSCAKPYVTTLIGFSRPSSKPRGRFLATRTVDNRRRGTPAPTEGGHQLRYSHRVWNQPRFVDNQAATSARSRCSNSAVVTVVGRAEREKTHELIPS